MTLYVLFVTSQCESPWCSWGDGGIDYVFELSDINSIDYNFDKHGVLKRVDCIYQM